MLKEAINNLRPLPGQSYIDCTLGDGGHALELLKKGSRVLGVDVYKKSIERASERIGNEGLGDSFVAARSNFIDLEKTAIKHGFKNVNGVLFDLGYSSPQLEEENLGLSFQKDEPLDMRLDNSLSVTAEDLLNTLTEKQLSGMMKELGGERMSKRFAKAIVRFRKLEKLHTSKQLADLIKGVAPSGYERGRLHPATRTFQALRVAVNDEIDNLKKALPQAARLLLPGGRMVIISFHSLEDRVVKRFDRPGAQPRVMKVTKKPLTPTPEEVQENVRARSARCIFPILLL